MSEQVQVQVCEGWWNLRDGRQVKVWRDASNERRPWFGEHGGIRFSWMADGRYHAGTNSPADLVEHVGQLPQAEPAPAPEPEPQPTPAPQPVKLRAGIWKTRSGHEVEVRENSSQLIPDFPWRGALFGVVEIWRNNGRWMNEMHYDHRDLVEYVGPLPQQTATDTLAEIEEQAVAEIEEALPVNPFEECRRLRAEVCRLQQAHQAMTEHSRELLESGQQARESRDSLQQQLAAMTYERDILAQRLVTKHSEKALQKENSRKQIEINTLQDKLANMTSERDEAANELRAMTDHCSRQREELQALSANRDQLAILLSNEQCARDMLQRQVQRLTAELRQAQIDLDAERETPAANCKAIVDAHLVGAQNGRQAAFEAVERWLEPLAGADSEHAAAVLQALPGCIRKLAELEGVTW